MPMMQSRRDFLASTAASATVSMLGAHESLADVGPPETTTVRLPFDPNICLAPADIAEDLLRAEGFSDVRYVSVAGGFAQPQKVADNEIDFGFTFAASVVFHLNTGVPVTTLAGLHPGCYELFAHDPVRTVSDLKGRRVGIKTLSSSGHLYVAIMANHVGLDPHRDIEWVTSPDGKAIELFADGKVDAFLGFPPEPQELRARNAGHVIVATATERPWSQYLCCMLFGNRAFVRAYPIATKRFLRAILKAADVCAREPAWAAQRLVDRGFTERYDYALQTLSEISYASWREFDPEDSLRFYALRLHEVGMIQSSPNQLIAEGTDWRFLEELKRELKA
jgi:NitT/TauT family transport system substrate-binding protein